MFGNLGNLMKQVQEAQKKASQIQEELSATVIESSAGGGLVTCRFTGTKELLDVTIDGAKLGLEPDDAELLQDAVLAALQEALRTVDERAKEAMSEMTEGLPIPPGMGF